MPCCSKGKLILMLIFLLALCGGGVYFFKQQPRFLEAKKTSPVSFEHNVMMATPTAMSLLQSKAHHGPNARPLPQMPAQRGEDPLLLFSQTMDVSPFYLVKYPQEAINKLTNFELSQVAEEEIIRLSEEFEKFYQSSPSRQQLINFFRYQSRNRLEVIKDQVVQLQRLQEKLEEVKGKGDQDAIRGLTQERQQRLDDLTTMINYENGVIAR